MALNADPAGRDARLVVVTGANGFIGRALCAHFTAEGRAHRRIVRTVTGYAPAAATIALGDLATVPEVDLAATLDGAFAVVHLAGRAHVMRETASDPAALFDAANVVATRRVAAAAARTGVRRMILASTVKVHGDVSRPGRPFRADDPMSPCDDYARSKAEAERAFVATCLQNELTPTILRLPLTYGPGVKGNFVSLMDAVARRKRLPLGAIHNRRHVLYVRNLVHAVARLLDLAQPPAGAWMIADTPALSTPELVERIARALQVEARLHAVPVALLKSAAALTRRSSMVSRLTESLEVDASPLLQMTGPPPFSVDDGLAETAKWWRGRHSI